MEKVAQNQGYFCKFQINWQHNNHPFGENLPNLVTLSSN
jgi:hypothetical protein